MREIKFRAWNIEEKIMHTIAFPSWNGCCEVWDENKPQTKTQQLSISEPEKQAILMQYTGLKDKNEKEIYEGDIVQNYGMEDEVIFDNGTFVGKNGQRDKFGQKQPIVIHSDIKIIGNIYENPNLLK